MQLILIIAQILAIKTVNAQNFVFLNDNNPLSMNPGDVSSLSSITIQKMIVENDYTNNPLQNPLNIQAGDCFKFQFQQILSYKSNNYSYFPLQTNQTIDCSQITPTVSCVQIDNWSFTMTVTDPDATNKYFDDDGFNGDLKYVQVPFSRVNSFQFQQIQFYQQGCSILTATSKNADPKLSTTGDFIQIQNPAQYVLFNNFNMQASSNILGYQVGDNILTLNLTPRTFLPLNGGQITIQSLTYYYQSLTTQSATTCPQGQYSTSCMKCTSTRFQGILGSQSGNTFTITYASLLGNQSDPITIFCSPFYNPITPSVTTFIVSSTDLSNNVIEQQTFQFDSSKFLPMNITDSQIQTQLSNKTVLSPSNYSISFKTPIPLEVQKGGCYMQILFPQELILGPQLYVYGTAQLSYTNVTSSTPIYNYFNQTPLYTYNPQKAPGQVIIQGCTWLPPSRAPTGVKLPIFNSQPQNINLILGLITNPFSQRTTSPFTIKIYANYQNDSTQQLSGALIQTLTYVIQQQQYQSNIISGLQLIAQNPIVQESTNLNITFNTSTRLAGSQSNMLQAIHLRMPSTFQSDQNNQAIIYSGGQNINIITSSTNTTIDNSIKYNPECQTNTCFLIQFNYSDIQPSQIIVQISNIINPPSIATAGNISISTMTQTINDNLFYKTDSSSIATNYQAQIGTIDPTSMFLGTIPINSQSQTFSDNQVLNISFTLTHKISVGGYIKVIVPQTFAMSSISSAIANYIVQDPQLQSYATIYSVNDTVLGPYILGQLNQDMQSNQNYSIVVGGLRNPRYLINNQILQESKRQYWQISTYDTNGFSDSQNLIDYGRGGLYDVANLSTISQFSAEAINTTTGVNTTYYLTWVTGVSTQTGDHLFVTFPSETKFYSPKNDSTLSCSSLSIRSLSAVSCSFNQQVLNISLDNVLLNTGLYKISVSNIQNPASVRGSSNFGQIYQTTNDSTQLVANFKQNASIEIDYAAQLQGLSNMSISQSNLEYGQTSEHNITFMPFNYLTTTNLTIQVYYPSTVHHSSSKCTVTYNGTTTDSSFCSRLSGNKYFQINGSVPVGYFGNITINLKMKNPDDNWGQLGYKIKTFENYSNQLYLVDQIQGNQIVPNLKCLAPCQQCPNNLTYQAKTYCQQCWTTNALKFLQNYSQFNQTDLSGNSTCLSSCSNGYTSNGDTKTFQCVKCNDTCSTCDDNGQVGDKYKCITCSANYPFIYTPLALCMQNCGEGYYQVTNNSCDMCVDPCMDCVGNKFNCTTCNSSSYLPALFTASYSGSILSTCLSQCPQSYYLDKSDPNNLFCGQCQSPCQTCETTKASCLSCDGSQNRYYNYHYNCYSQCPSKTAPDMNTLNCIDCPVNCNKCGTQGGASCYECVRPWLLEDGECHDHCYNQGYFPNKAGTICINTIEFPTLGPIFFIISIVLSIAICIIKCIKEETVRTPSIIAMVGCIQWISILFQIYLTALYNQPKFLGLTLFSFFVLMILNIANFIYIRYKVIDENAKAQTQISKQQILILIKEQKKRKKREEKYRKALDLHKQKYQGGQQSQYKPLQQKEDDDKDFKEINDIDDDDNEGGNYEEHWIELKNLKLNNIKQYDLDVLSDIGSSISQNDNSLSDDDKQQFEGGCLNQIKEEQSEELDEQTLCNHNIIKDGQNYYKEKDIQDLGYMKWKQAYEQAESVIRWVSLIISFKFYRMTYSYFMGRKCFLVIYQKKKFKKMLVALTLVSQFFVEVPLIVNSVVAMTQIVLGQQLMYTMLDTLLLSIFLVIIEFYEISQLDKIMKTINTHGHRQKKSEAAQESSEDDDPSTSEEEDQSDDYPDWKLMLKNVEGNPNLFITNQKQIKINDLAKKFDPRIALSCIDFNTGTEIEDDPRLVKSFPCSPKEYKDFEGFDYGNFGSKFDNVYAESRAPRERDHGKTFSEMGTQAQPSEILTALARKGGNLLTPGVDNEDYQRRKGIKKKRGRKNKYYKQIDAEDDEEADQMSDGSDDDGLDGIKEEDEEDEEERLAKIAKIKAEAEKKAKEDEDKRIQAAKEEQAKRKSAEEQKRKTAEEQSKKIAEEQNRKTADELRRKTTEEEQRKQEEKAQKEIEDLLKKEGQSDVQSELSLLMGKSTTLQKFGVQGSQVMEVPPNAEKRTFNECDIIGNLDRDEKGNVLANVVDENKGIFKDKDGNFTNQRGYLLEPKTGDIVNNMNGQKMFDKKDLDEKGEIPAPFNVEKHNFNPHYCRGNFDYDQNGKAIVQKDQRTGNYVDKDGERVSSRGYRIDKAGNLIDNHKRKKFDKSHMTPDGDLPKFFNYNGRRFDITDIIGQIDKDKQGNLILLTDQNGNYVDNLGRRVNSRGYLIDEFGNVIDKDGRQIFEQKHLKNDEIPKILPFTKFNIKNILGDFEMDPLGNPILDRDAKGNLIDRQGKQVNQKGYLIDDQGNVINKYGKIMFERSLLDNEEDIPKVFRTGLLKSDTASSLSRLMSEIGKNQPSEFDQEEQRIQEEIAQNIRKQKRGNSGNTSVDSMMEDTPANYNFQNQRFDEAGNLLANVEDQEMEEEDDDDDYGSQYEQIMGRTGMSGIGTGGHELAKKKRKKKKKKKKKKIEYEDPSLREHLLAGAYGGIAKPKPKRAGVKYTTDLDAGLRDIATPAMFLRDPSKKMITSFSGFANIAGNVPDSSRGKGKGTNRMKSSQGRSEIGSNIGSKIGGLKKPIGLESTSKLLDPQQREDQLKRDQMEEINRKKAIAAKKKKINATAGGRPGKISKDADFEKMFGKDIDEFLEDSEWDIESIDKMSQFSKNSKQTIRSAAQAGKLRGLEKLYLQRIETSMNKNTLNAAQVTQIAAGKPQKKKANKFREFQDRYVDDPQYIARGGGQEQESSGASPSKNPPQRARQAWDTGSRVSKGSQNQSVKKVFKANN